MDLGLKGHVAVVTGAGRGIGRQLCLTLATEGVCVGVNDLFADRAEAVAAEIRLAGGEAIALPADVTNEEDVRETFVRATKEWGRLDLLVNNAGIAVPQPTEEAMAAGGAHFVDTTSDQWRRTMDVITYGVLYCSRAALDTMIPRQSGRIVTIISDAGRVGEPGLVAYSMAKAGVMGFTKALAKEVGRYCVTVNCVSPSTTETESTADLLRDHRDRVMRPYPLARGLNRLGLPSDVADAVVFLASRRAEWITGQVLSVNGGYAMPD